MLIANLGILSYYVYYYLSWSDKPGELAWLALLIFLDA